MTMTINYTWQFPALDVKYSEGELKNVVTTVHWVMVAEEGEHTASVYGSVGVPEPTPEAFVTYENLTQEEVESWVTEALGEEQIQTMKDGLAGQIETLKAPVTGTLTPPWNAPAPVVEEVVEPEVEETVIVDTSGEDEVVEPEVVVDTAGESV